jgi:hypothetical protein
MYENVLLEFEFYVYTTIDGSVELLTYMLYT